ncbi:MAG: DUF167 domain-containing protein [Desulfuromonadales bacterium]|nr:DUF167 domain-containing protein [Desulfuromonadales bacterium]
MLPPWLQIREHGVAIHLLVQPRASKNEVIGAQGDELKVRLTSPPVEGAANRLCCEFIAKKLGLAKSAVTLETGETSRHKRLFLPGVSATEVLAALTAPDQ